MCQGPQEAVLSRYELQGLRTLREWLGNQPDDGCPEELAQPQALRQSMMVRMKLYSVILHPAMYVSIAILPVCH